MGHWDEFRHAMFTSNLEKQSANPFQYAGRIFGMLFKIWLIAALVLVSIRRVADPFKGFALAWVLAALAGFLAVPNFYAHYLLPVAVSVSAIAAIELNRRFFGVVWAGLVMLEAVIVSRPYALDKHQKSTASMYGMAQMIKGQETFLAFDAPPMLYVLSGQKPITPLAFPNHLNHEIERNVSHLDTRDEMLRILATRPDSIAISEEPRVIQYNRENWALVTSYITENCVYLGEGGSYELRREDRIFVYGDCL